MPELRELLNDNDPSVHAEALVALESLAGKGAPPAELKSLSATLSSRDAGHIQLPDGRADRDARRR